MPAAALKKKPRIVEAASAIPDARLALHDCIERKRKADRAVEAQNDSLMRAREMIGKAEEEIEKLKKKIAEADLTDVKRAASLVKAERPIASAWVGENARRAVSAAEERLRLTEAALQRLKHDLVEMQDDVAAAQNAILVEVKKLVVPLIEKMVTKLREAKHQKMIAMSVLNELLDDDLGRRSVRFSSNGIRAMRADDAREAPLKQFRTEVENLRFGQADDADYAAVETAVEMVKAALLALQTDATATLPEF